ncbi:tryptophan transporter [Bacillus taeanensis]|uniref:Tryptophan transporter n=1 Tax=Bacillus taeanensis TaxID=273032 RepID=A0A366XX33_9BACI|nr:tryptophan transporter [Bacillus taeanensis]RBW69329.1 tryptophan transporter [Bacillus taeanensis]
MKTKNLVFMALLLGIGVVLHAVVPPFFFGMKPDMLLVMMFLGILLFPEKKHVLMLGLAAGLISAATTNFPGGQLPNVIDKTMTAYIFFGMLLIITKFRYSTVTAAILAAVGTLVSGTIFLTAAFYIVSLPAPFLALFLSVVLPATIVNTAAIAVVYPITQTIMKRSKLAY